MKLVRIIAFAGLYLSRLISIAYFATALYVLCSVLLKLPSYKQLDNNRFAIDYPFTTTHFLLGSANTAIYIAEMIAILIVYGIFFWLLGNVFKTFSQQRLFTSQGVRHLQQFLIMNLFICPLFFVVLSFYSIEDYPYAPMIIAHIIIGIFAKFLAAIFEQGLQLQTDQDLYI